MHHPVKTISFFRQILTGKDNKTFDLVRVGMFAAFILLCVESLWGVCMSGAVDLAKLGEMMKCFASSVAEILGWGSLGCAAKFHTEPEADKG